MSGSRASPPPAAADAARVMAAAAPAVLLAAWETGGPAPGLGLAVAAAGWALAAALVTRGVVRGHPHARFGAANLVTTLRAAAVAVLAAGAAQASGGALSGWALVALAAAALALDGVDGLVARTLGRASEFGARYDVEVDSAFALVLAVLVWRTGPQGAWILALGLPRYAFLAAARLDPELGGALPPSRARKAVCVAQIGTLVALLVPGLPAALGTALAVASLAALAWSFGRDVAHLKCRP
jgi:phosphatidylglycerophosphate synthase